MDGSGDAQASFLRDLTAAGLLVRTGVAGVYGRSAAFEHVRRAVDDLITRAAAPDGAERLAFPPVMPRHELERIGYLENFPHLAGSVFSFAGDEDSAVEQARRAAAHEDWSAFQHATDLVLVPAACYPSYPALAERGPLARGGATLDLGGSYVFRHEPSGDPARLQMFHQREMVRLGSPVEVTDWREAWCGRAVELLGSLGLGARLDVAADPFFGRTGRLLARSQRAQELKFEVTVPIANAEPTAVASFNYHLEHFSSVYGIELEGGGRAHTACLGFGLERIALALFRAHGLESETWPAPVREVLGLPCS